MPRVEEDSLDYRLKNKIMLVSFVLHAKKKIDSTAHDIISYLSNKYT
jgi:hypothetical protein